MVQAVDRFRPFQAVDHFRPWTVDRGPKKTMNRELDNTLRLSSSTAYFVRG